MLTNAPILAIVPTTDITRAKAFYGETLGLTDANLSTPGPQVFYRCGGGTLLEVYERPTAGQAQHTLASWAVSEVRAAVNELRDRGVRFEEYDAPGLKTDDASQPPEISRRPGFAMPTATSSAFIPISTYRAWGVNSGIRTNLASQGITRFNWISSDIPRFGCTAATESRGR